MHLKVCTKGVQLKRYITATTEFNERTSIVVYDMAVQMRNLVNKVIKLHIARDRKIRG